MNILIVDDAKSIRDLIRALLATIGKFDIDQCEDGNSALFKINSNSYDLVITDMNMPGMTGLELLKAIRSSENAKKVPVVLLTADSARESISEAIALGISGYIIKPFKPDKFISDIQKVITASMPPGAK
ncbi:MAG: response regulator [Nitrosomonadales bacterium]|nr:response regulator [Nitrosomonadales bacterium]